MKKKLSVVFMAVVLLMTLTTAAAAISYPNSGAYIGTFTGNDDMATVEAALSGVDLILGSKATPGEVYEGDFPLYISSSDGWLSGLWATFVALEPPVPPGAVLVSYYTVKAGPQFALYLVDPASAYGTWSTIDLLVGAGQQPTISHFSGFTTTSVPEPTTLLLLGLGLVGIAGIGRKLKK